MAIAAYEALPEAFRDLCGDVEIRIADFADEAALDSVGVEDPLDLMGLFEGVGLAQGGAASWTGQMPNAVWLYRRAILDYWAENEETLGTIISHVLIHELGHHFGLSDEDMERVESEAG
ncbi:metallopeptidase family protein [Stappia sp. F7233]|uniref:Metallopeptidase family protein n=2 Tax=Stappia albiluteola TaxID=2758565 RepID=A0A839AFI0_9HYPH|nr:metallopeptidase family protein [Stappia albiluteola]MBA5778473.1 metallopeptidase family protein [Stappia albiluteola]